MYEEKVWNLGIETPNIKILILFWFLNLDMKWKTNKWEQADGSIHNRSFKLFHFHHFSFLAV